MGHTLYKADETKCKCDRSRARIGVRIGALLQPSRDRHLCILQKEWPALRVDRQLRQEEFHKI